MTNRAVLYARVSSDDSYREGRNLQAQLAMGRDYALLKGYLIVEELPEDDKGASGASFDLPQLNKIREMASNSEFDVLVVREVDRLSRNLAKQLIVEEELRRCGVRVEYVLGEYDDTPEGRLNKHIRATIAEYEREKIKERMTRGRRNKVKAGAILLHGDQPPYGYRLSEDGKTLVIFEPEARIVRLIFTLYAVGDEDGKKFGSKALARKLTEMGIPTWKDTHNRGYKKRGYAQWADGTITGILTNETYLGNWYYGRKRRPDFINPKEHWLALNVPPIIDQRLWKKAQDQKELNTEVAKRNVRTDYLIGRRVVCGKCGCKMHARSSPTKNKDGKRVVYKYYICGAKTGDYFGKSCDAPSFIVEIVDTAVWNHISEILADPEKLEEGLRVYHKERERINTPLRERLAIVNDLITDNQAQLERLLDLYLTGSIAKEMLTERKERLEKTLTALRKEQGTLTSQLSEAVLNEEQIQRIKESFASTITRGIDLAGADFDKRRFIIDSLDVRVTLKEENGKRIAYLSHLLDPDETILLIEPDSTCKRSPPEPGVFPICR